MLTEATFKQTIYIFSFLWHEILVLIFDIFYYLHSFSVILYENLDLIIIFCTLLQNCFCLIYYSKYYHCSSFPNRGDLQIDMKRRSHNLRSSQLVILNNRSICVWHPRIFATCLLWKCRYRVYWNLSYSWSILKVIFFKSNRFRLKKGKKKKKKNIYG
jgi:hypothetical protein